jgi:hypothetical protein
VSSSTQDKDKIKDKDTTSIMAANQQEPQALEFEDEMRADEVFQGFLGLTREVIADGARNREVLKEAFKEARADDVKTRQQLVGLVGILILVMTALLAYQCFKVSLSTPPADYLIP